MIAGNKDELLVSLDQVMPLIEKIKKESFPELADIDLKLGTVNSDSVFLESRPVIHSLFISMKVRYKITVNPKLFDMQLPLFALEGILAHELAHTSFYVKKGRFGTIFTGFVFLNHKKHVEFERRTDIDAITRGYGEGIKLYREVVFRDLTQEQRQTKNERYFSEQEIDQLMAGVAEYPELRQVWLDNPPFNLTEISSDITVIASQNNNQEIANIS